MRHRIPWRPQRPAPLAAWVAMAVLIALLFHAQGNKIDDNTLRIKTAELQARNVQQLTTAIQRERRRSMRASCEAQNQRFDAAKATYDKLVDEVVRTGTPAQIQEAQAGRAGTLSLIRALVPRQDCEALIAARVVAPPP